MFVCVCVCVCVCARARVRALCVLTRNNVLKSNVYTVILCVRWWWWVGVGRAGGEKSVVVGVHVVCVYVCVHVWL